MSKKLMFLTLMALVLIMAVVACRAEVDQEVISFTDSATENVLIALNNQDYESFKQDMDDVVLGTINEQGFINLSTYITDTVGEYTTIYWGGSLAEKMISRVYFVMQSAYFLHFRSRHVCHTFGQAKMCSIS